MNTEPQLRVVSKNSRTTAWTTAADAYMRGEQLKDARRRHFFLGWCAGLLTALLMLLAVRAEACGDLPTPDETIQRIRVVAI